MKKQTKTLIKKVLLWLVLGYVFGYLAGAIVIIFYEGLGIDPLIYLFGIIFSGILLAMTGPLFLLMVFLWTKWVKKSPSIDKNWGLVILFSLIFALINGFAFWLFTGREVLDFHPAFFLTSFFGGLAGALIPRVVVKSLRPGRLLD